MAKLPKRVRYGNGEDLLKVIDEVRSDKESRILEKDGEEVAVIVSTEEYVELTGEPKSKRNKAKLLAIAGAWKDADTDKMVEEIYRARHESPASTPVHL